MPINFPDSPSLNQVFIANNRSWVWDGTVWSSSGSVGNTGPQGATGPAGPTGPAGVVSEDDLDTISAAQIMGIY